MSNEQVYIDWDKNYNVVFYLRIDPVSKNISIVTNANGNCKTLWKHVDKETEKGFKKNWDKIQLTLNDYKYLQIVKDKLFRM